MAFFFHVKSLPQVTLNLVAQFTWDLAVRWRTPSPLPHTTVVTGPSTQSLLTRYISILFMLPAKLAIIYRNIFTFIYILKETFKLWASSCHVKGPLPLPTTYKILLGRAACARSELGGPWHGSSYFFSYLGWQDFHGPGLIWPEFSDFWYFLQNKSKRHHCRGKSWSKKYRENTSPGMWFFFIIFLLQRFLSCKHSKKPGHIWPWLWKIVLIEFTSFSRSFASTFLSTYSIRIYVLPLTNGSIYIYCRYIYLHHISLSIYIHISISIYLYFYIYISLYIHIYMLPFQTENGSPGDFP